MCGSEQMLCVYSEYFNARFGPKRDEVKGGSRELHNEELHVLFSKYN
jgi:hypothetical protein